MFHSITAKKYWGDRDFLKRFLIIALPIAVQNGITNFVNMLDNVMVGQLGTHQMNGVSIVNQIFLIPFLCLFGAMAGAGIFTAQFYGSGDSEGIKYTFRFNIGIGALMKVKKYKIENNTLINVGANYLVISIEKEFLIVKIFNNSILENNNNHNKKFILKRFKIDKKDFALTIGRNKKCDISIDDMMMSKVQSTIKYNYKEKNFYLFDGNSQKESMNGTWVYILNPVLITDNFVFKAEHTLFVINVNNNKN